MNNNEQQQSLNRLILNQSQNSQWPNYQTPQPLMLQNPIILNPNPVPLMLVSPQVPQPQVQPHHPLNYNQFTAQKPVENIKQSTFKIERFDSKEKNIENFINDYFHNQVNLKNKNDESKDELNIEIQTIDYNHGFSACTNTTIKMGPLNPNKNSFENQQNPKSFLSLNLEPNDLLQNNNNNISCSKQVSSENKIKQIPIQNLLLKPGRDHRPYKILIILRGLPGSGKSFLANLIKQEEEKYVSSTNKPKLLSIDNYFITEQELGQSTKTQILMKYEYDESMNEAYQKSLVKSFKKLIDDDLFNFIIVDMINEKLDKIDEMSSYAKQRGFQTFIAELTNDLNICFDRNVHNRSLDDIKKIWNNWESLPDFYKRLDVSFFVQNQEIQQIEMDDANTIYDNFLK